MSENDPRAEERERRTTMSDQERTRGFAQRWATPGNDPFEQWFWTMFRYFNRKVDPEILEIYRKMLGHIPIPELEAVFHDYIMEPDISAREPPKVNVLYAKWKARKEIQEGKRAQRRASRQTDAVDEIEDDPLRKRMYPLIAHSILGEGMLRHLMVDAPEWMRTIAQWTVDQFHSQHPGKEFYELGEAQQREVFDRAIRLFEEERSQHEPEAPTPPPPPRPGAGDVE